MPAHVECCLNNTTAALEKQLAELDIDLRKYRCLQQCGHCYENPFLVVEGGLRLAERHADLVDELQSEFGRSGER